MPEGDIYIGLMSGTSMDAIDTVLVQFEDNFPKILAYQQFPIEQEIKAAVRRLDGKSSLSAVTECDAVMGHLFAESVLKILDQSKISAEQVSAIGNHGQTILHLPDEQYPRTLQIGDPNIIAHKTKITTVADFRRMDIASGGQGAPLAPAFHEQVFRKKGIDRIILNLGGIANITLLPGDPSENISGFDTGPGNGLLDDWNQLHQSTEMDRNSEWAATGQYDDQLLATLLSDPYFKLAPPKSSGRDYFNLTWLKSYIEQSACSLSPEDVQATLLSLSVNSIAQAVNTKSPNVSEIYACGGGAHNTRLMQQLQEQLPNIKVYDTEKIGLHPDAIEAITFAWLAKQRLEKLPGNQPSVTGANSLEVLGGIYQSRSDLSAQV